MLRFVPRLDHFFGLECDTHHLILLCSARTVLLFFSLSFFLFCAVPRIPGVRGRGARPLLCYLCFRTIFFSLRHVLGLLHPWFSTPSPPVSFLPTWHRSMADVSLSFCPCGSLSSSLVRIRPPSLPIHLSPAAEVEGFGLGTKRNFVGLPRACFLRNNPPRFRASVFFGKQTS